jgi:hypothetical protein
MAGADDVARPGEAVARRSGYRLVAPTAPSGSAFKNAVDPEV